MSRARPSKWLRLPPMRVVNRYSEALSVSEVRDLPIDPGEVVEVPAHLGWRLCRGGLSEAMPPVPVSVAAGSSGPLFHPADAPSMNTFTEVEKWQRSNQRGRRSLQRVAGGYVARCPSCNVWLARMDVAVVIVDMNPLCGGWLVPDDAVATRQEVFIDGDSFYCARCEASVRFFR